MCSRGQCLRYVGQYVRFRSPYGYHEGVIQGVSGNKATVLSPKKFIPVQLATYEVAELTEDERLDLALAWGGYGGARVPYAGGYGGWGYGWGRWAVSFLVIYALWGLLW